jgi:hypothetical protein
MTKKIFVFGVGVFCFFFFFFYMDDLTLNDITFILGVDMNASMYMEIHETYDKPFIYMKK